MRKKIYKFINSYKDHGLSWTKKKNLEQKFVYNKDFFGTNYRLTEVQSVVGINQLKKINDTLKKRNYIAQGYIKIFKNYSNIVNFYSPPKNIKSSWYRFYIFINKKIQKKKKFEK